MTFICAQPDAPLFIWQLKTLLFSLIKLRVKRQNIVLLFLLEKGHSPSHESGNLQKYATVFYYPERTGGRIYSASSKPYLFGRHWEAFPENRDKHHLFVESDMLVYRIPNLPKNDTWYWSDASQYLETGRFESLLGYKPIKGKAFGFHAYGKGTDANYWYKIEKESQELYTQMTLNNTGGNKWICEMRAWMWNSAGRFKNEISSEMVFNDGYGPHRKNASLYHHLEKKIFYKRKYLHKPPFDEVSTIDPNFSANDYLKGIKDAGYYFKFNDSG